MLALQDFIMKNEDWKEKLSNPPYSLIIKELTSFTNPTIKYILVF